MVRATYSPSGPFEHLHPDLAFDMSSFLWKSSLTFSGAGPIGLVTLLAAHAAGCTPIAITDLVASRLEFAKTLVPTVRTILLERADSPERNSEKIKAELGLQPRVALECTGFESSIRAAIYVSFLAERLR